MRTVFLATSETYEDDFIAVAFALESADVTTRGELLDLARKAVRLYALTDDGMIDFENSSYGFDWGDLMDCAEEKTFRPPPKSRERIGQSSPASRKRKMTLPSTDNAIFFIYQLSEQKF